MTEVQIKHAQFQYFVETPSVDPATGKETTRLGSVIALRDQIVDIPRDEDIERGEAAGAFYTEEDFAEATEGETEEADDEAEPSPAPSDPTHDNLVVWIRDERPNAATVVAKAGDDPAMAQALIAAENEASGGDPRKSVIEPLNKIAGT